MKRSGMQLVVCGSCTHPEFMTIRGGSLCPTEYPAVVGLIDHPDEGLILFDTGYDPAFIEATHPFPERFYRWSTPVQLKPDETAAEWIARIGCSPADVRAIVLSHFHGDHIAGLHAFPNAKIFCSAAGLRELRRHGRVGRVRRGLLSRLVPDTLGGRAMFFEDCALHRLPTDFAPFEDAADLFGDGSLAAVPLPGHCPGHWGLALRLADDRHAFLIADAAWSSRAVRDAIPPPRLTTALLGETRAYRQTLGRVSSLSHRNREMLILPSHCPVAARDSGLLRKADA